MENCDFDSTIMADVSSININENLDVFYEVVFNVGG